MTSCCPRRRMRWSGATGAIARCKNRSTGYVRKLRSAHAWRWTCGEKPKGQGATKPSTPYMRHVLPKATRYPCYSLLEAVRKLMSNKSTSWKSLKAWQETDYPISPFLALPCLWHKILPYKGFVSRQPLIGKPQSVDGGLENTPPKAVCYESYAMNTGEPEGDAKEGGE